MKKFMLLLLVALLSGCATENPHYKNAQTIGGTGVGAVIGYKTLGGGVLGGLAGAVVVHEVAKGAQWKPGDEEIVYIDPPGYYPQSGYSSCGHVNVYCDTIPKQGMYPPRPGMCNDPDSGGEAAYEDLVRRAEQRAGCYRSNNAGYNYYPQQQQVVLYPANMWKRPENRHQKDSRIEGSRLNVENYTQAGALPADCNCQTGNWAVDSVRLRTKAAALKELQGRCVKGEENTDCYQNPGILSREYYDLAASLDARQEEGEKRKFVKK